jgi:hypothetical protein
MDHADCPGFARAFRQAYVASMQAYNAGEGKRMRSSTLPLLIRHSACHVMDHAWEMEDKDHSGETGTLGDAAVRHRSTRGRRRAATGRECLGACGGPGPRTAGRQIGIERVG